MLWCLLFSTEINTTSGSASQHALTQTIFPDGTTRTFTYDTQGRLSTVARDNNGEKITFSYEDSGRVNVTDALGNTSRFFFDYAGRMVKGENALGEAVKLSFDEIGNLSTITDPDGMSSTFQYNNRGNIVEISDALRQSTKFTYTRNLNRLTSVTDAKGNRSNYDYDDRGNLNSITYPDGNTESWVYDVKGNPTAWTNRRGKAVNFTYDSDGNVTGKTYSDGSQASYTYDNRNNLTQAVDKSGTTTFSYDADDHLVRIDYPNNRWLLFTYDTVGRRSSSSDQLGYTINYYYDNAGRLSRISDGTTDIVSYGYDLVGRLDRKTMGNGVYTTYSYDAAGRLLSLVNYTPNNQELSRFVYTYDRRSRRTSMNTNYGKWTYSYDDIGQLIRSVLISTKPEIPNQDIAYQYDELGNRTKVITNGNSESYDSNNLNQYTKVGDLTYTYDADGNLIEESGADGTTTYTYNDDNRLVGISKGTDKWEYTYDALGNRVAVDENGSTTHYVVDPVGLGDLVGEYDSGGNLVARYNHGIGLLSRITSGAFGSTDYYTFDPMGNTTELTGTAGVIKNSYAYEPFGKTILKNQTVPNPFQFVGEMGIVLDTNGLNHVRARQYICSIGRFIQSDPIGILDGLNSYTYAINNTLSFTDISGLYTGNLGALPKIIGFDNASGAGAEMIKNIFTQAQLNGARAKTVKEVFVKGVWKYGKYFSSVEKAERFARIQRFSAVVKAKRIASAAKAIPQAIGYSKMAIASNVAAAYLAFEAGYFIGEALDTHVPNNWLSVSAYKLSSKLCDWYYGVSGAEFTSGTAGSQDPNQKLAVSGYGTSNFVPQDKLLTYRIDFENDNQATAPAQVVQISDPLSSDLDWSTFEITEVGFGNVVVTVPSGLKHFEKVIDYSYTDQDYDINIEVHVTVWIENGQVFANFFSIDPETDMPPQNVGVGFLMPENDTGRGQGYISYSIKPKTGLATGTAIRNVATIQFDFSLKIDTNQIDPHNPAQGTDPNKEALVTIDSDLPLSSVNVLPETSPLSFIVEWSGQDGTSGTGSYTIYIQDNGAEFKEWIANSKETSAVFTGEMGHTYGFYSIAKDNAGNVEPSKTLAETSTLIDKDYSFIVLVDSTPATIYPGIFVYVYGSQGVNKITVEKGAVARLINFPGSNEITIKSESNLFTASRSGATVTIQGSDGTKLIIPATRTAQSIIFNDKTMTLIIDGNQVKLGGEVVELM